MISKITDKILPEIKEWQTRHLEEVYPIVFMDAIHYSVRQDGIAIKKAVYKAITLDQASNNLLHLEEKWGKKYKAAIKSWHDNWEELTTYFKYPEEIRKIIYTTNSIENFNRQLRKYTKTKSSYPTDDSLSKSIYLSIKEITKKWTGKVQNWGQIVSQLSIYFEGRI